MDKKHFWSQYLAEFIGTFFMVFFGCGAAILSQVNPESMESFIIPIVFGGTVSIMIYATGHISGAHFNPAVTLAFWVVKRFPAYRIPGYLISQFGGATFASFIHCIVWGDLHHFGLTSISSSLGIGILVEFILAFALMFVIISVATDSRAVGELAGIAIGSTVTVCAFVGGPLTGASMNPARSFGPAVMSGNLDDIWVYLIIPFAGTMIAAITYEKIRCNHENNSSQNHGCC